MSDRTSVESHGAGMSYRLGRVLVCVEDGPLETPCHIWKGTTQHGYANRRVNGELELEHRRVWRNANGPIPKTHRVHHLCGNRRCIRLSHLELVHAGEHMQMHIRRREEFSPEVTDVLLHQPTQDMRAIEDHRLLPYRGIRQ